MTVHRDRGEADGGESLGRRAAGGVAWQGGAFVFGKVVLLATTVILARLLAPEDFGAVALALVVVSYVDVIADLGVAQSLVVLPLERGRTRAAITFSIAAGAVLYAVAWIATPGLLTLLGNSDPQMEAVLRTLLLMLPVGAVASVPEALMRRQLRFRALTGATMIRSIVVGAVSVSLALAGAQVWALVAGTVSGAVVYAMILLWTERAQLDFRFWRTRSAAARSVLHFGLPAASGALVAKIASDVDYVIVARMLGLEELGYYTMAFRLPELLIVNVFFVVSSVMYPIYSASRRDPRELRRNYLASVRLQSVYGFFAGGLMAVLAMPMVLVGLGANWVPAVLPLAALAGYAAFRSLGAGANDLYKAVERPGLTVVIGIGRLVVLVPALILAAAKAGIVGVALAQAAAALLTALVTQTIAMRILQAGRREVVSTLAPAVVALVAALTGGAFGVWVGGQLHSPIAALTAGAGVAVILAIASLRWAFPEIVRSSANLLRRRAVTSEEGQRHEPA